MNGSLPLESNQAKVIAKRIESGWEGILVAHHRQWCVLYEFPLYKSPFQLDLAESAIIWAIASLASDEGVAACETYFVASVDRLYVSTDDGQKLDDEGRRKISEPADAVFHKLVPVIGRVLNASAHRLGQLGQNDIRLEAASLLHRIRTTYLEHLTTLQLQELTVRCVRFCTATKAFRAGVKLPAEYLEEFSDAIRFLAEIESEILRQIDNGMLVVKDDKILNPAASAP